jgi:indole-3-glycerol phosphate synthase
VTRKTDELGLNPAKNVFDFAPVFLYKETILIENSMPDFLNTILDQRRRDVADAMAHIPLASLRARAESTRATRRSFAARLQSAGPVGIIAEIKRASPSKGDLAPDLDPAALARAYEAGGASCLSILTEPHFFKGSPADLATARAACALPVLRKDFLFCDYQLVESAAMGADCLTADIAPKESACNIRTGSFDVVQRAQHPIWASQR